MVSPCKECDERELGCHSHCIAYKRWKAKHGEIVIRIHEDETASKTWKIRSGESYGVRHELSEAAGEILQGLSYDVPC